MVQLRNCMVAIVVLTAVLISCLPLFFSGVPTKLKSLAIPNKPSFPSPDQFNPGLSDISQAFKNPLQLPLSPETAWVLQVADFKENSDANALTQSLRQKGFKAYTRQIMLPTGLVITRVFIGPEIKSEQIKILETRLNKEMQLKSAVVAAFDPLLL